MITPWVGFLISLLIGCLVGAFAVCPLLAWLEDRTSYRDYIRSLFSR